MRSLAFVALVATAMLFQARPAGACMCLQAGFELLAPAPGRAPTNTKIRVAYVDSWELPMAVVLRSDGGIFIASSVTTFASGDLRIVELSPDSELSVDTKYEVVAIELGPQGSATVVGTFETGASVDDTPPVWSGARKAVFVKPRSQPARRAQSPTGEVACTSDTPYAVVFAAPAIDDDTPASSILYGVWMPDSTGRVDTSTPPHIYLPIHDGKISLGSASSCDPRRFLFPPRTRVRLGLAAVDNAGNQSDPIELTLQLR